MPFYYAKVRDNDDLACGILLLRKSHLGGKKANGAYVVYLQLFYIRKRRVDIILESS